MRDFFKWFLSIGYRKYTIGYLIIGMVNYGFISIYGNMLRDNNILIFILANLVILLFNFGITYHVITNFKKYRDSKKD